jgi:hypothetical protein
LLRASGSSSTTIVRIFAGPASVLRPGGTITP